MNKLHLYGFIFLCLLVASISVTIRFGVLQASILTILAGIFLGQVAKEITKRKNSWKNLN